MFTQKKFETAKETSATNPVFHEKCSGCDARCVINAAWAPEYAAWHPMIGGQRIDCYYDINGKKQVIFAATCPSESKAFHLATEIARLCEKHNKITQR